VEYLDVVSPNSVTTSQGISFSDEQSVFLRISKWPAFLMSFENHIIDGLQLSISKIDDECQVNIDCVRDYYRASRDIECSSAILKRLADKDGYVLYLHANDI
jgi:hypothetical protein